MAPAGLYTFYRAIMTLSNEVKLSSPSRLSLFSFSVLLSPLFRSDSLPRIAEKECKEESKMKRKKLDKELRNAVGVLARILLTCRLRYFVILFDRLE